MTWTWSKITLFKIPNDLQDDISLWSNKMLKTLTKKKKKKKKKKYVSIKTYSTYINYFNECKSQFKNIQNEEIELSQ